jgi:hypothetical protein
VSCTPRIQPLPASDISIAGAAMTALRNHGSACSAMSALDAIADTIGTAAACTTTMNSTPSASASQVACTPSRTADTLSPAPKRRAERAVVP